MCLLRTLLIAATVSTLGLALPLAMEATLPRHPAPSPDGSEIAFSWQGDIWIVNGEGGMARRMTANPAADRFPLWSPDGRYIAFESWRYGNADVFVVPSDASAAPRRLTFASVDDHPLDFTPDGTAVLFSSRRDVSILRVPGLYTVPVTGGTPRLEQSALGRDAAYSPDGTRLAFVRGDTYWWRRGYRGAANREIWLRRGDGTLAQLTHFAGDDDNPCWADESHLVFLSSRAGRKNLFRLDLDGGEPEQLTFHEGSAVRYPRISADGRIVAYEFETGIYVIRSDGGETRRVPIEVSPDWVRPPVERHTESQGARELAISPDGKLAAFTLHGEIFLTGVRSKKDQEIAKAPTVRLTSTAHQEREIAWAPDGKALFFTSDRGGSDDIFSLRPADPELGWLKNIDFPAEPAVATAAEEHSAKPSPDGKVIAFIRGKGDLIVRRLDTGEETLIHPHWYTTEFEWSPDGRWLAYSTPDEEFNSEVWLVPAAGGKAYNVSRHPDEDRSPHWSKDGKRLVWLSKRHADTLDVWSVWLTREDQERSPEQWLAYWKDLEKKGKKGKKSGEEEERKAANGSVKKKGHNKKGDEKKQTGEGPEKKLPEVKIDFDRLWERVTALTNLPGDEGSPRVAAAGKKILYTAATDGKRDLYAASWNGKKPKRLTKGGKNPRAVQLGEKGEKIFYITGKGVIESVSLEGKSGDPIPYAARYEVDTAAEREVIFGAAWRALEEWFYDPHFHGVDWAAAREKYRPWALGASDHRDFADMMNLMLGELDASHMGYRPRREAGEQTGWIGALFDPDAAGPGLLVSEVLEDSPAARTDVALKAGERLLAVGSDKLGPHTNVYGLFADTAGRRTALTIAGKDGKKRHVVVTPASFGTQRRLRYETWVRQRRAIVDRLSGGRLGYIHIQGMSMPSFEEFERDLYSAAHGKEGLLIDVRANGGGWTTDYLMAVLTVKRHAYTIPRDADPKTRAYPQSRLPLAAWTRPAAALCNEESYSNAEIFSRAFKNLERGPLVGTETFGAVISTSGTVMANGDWVRLPFRGWYDAITGENQERHGVGPTVPVAQPPGEDTAADEDTQLAAAVRTLLEDLPHDPRRDAW